ncbi:uncharacterized protein LOC128550992 [Mercenaria mercenaria]|uniref:uncharacterized protein LOC128550992 n=1 Tax=Mercenaria mercenaria TaxID=6596 RepID=UPI00234F429E|nr:uncharacterized protein LOC128550992 [Mercenaria mercenaria]
MYPGIFFPGTDFDFMMLYTKFTVKDFTGENKETIDENEAICRAKRESDCAFIMVPSTHLGYVKVFVAEKGRKLLQEKESVLMKHIDEEGFLTNDAFKEGIVTDQSTEIIYSRLPEMKYIASGPAISNYEHEEIGYTYDFVNAFPCETWPEVANRWNKRPRDANWPHEDLRNEIMKDGCAIVPVGFYTSTEQKREWRLSFNSSERKLSLSLSENQKICYCIVKLLIKATLSPDAVLTSYMVKNMMFWFCEQQYGVADWGDDQLGDRVLQLISYICTALEHSNIPHYFLPYNNLIRHKPKEDIQVTLREMEKLRTSPFQSLANVCIKMHVFEIGKDTRMFSTGGELQSMLTLFTCSVQLLIKLGLLNYDAPDFAMKCFDTVIELNTAVKPFIRQSSNLFAATRVPQLLKPFAVQYMQNGQVDQALALFQMSFEADRTLVIEQFPDIISNIACLTATKIDLVGDKTRKEELSSKANEYFKQALKNIADSPTLHFAYGSFLKERKISITQAIAQFEKAISIEKKRDDDDALIEITLPGKQNPGSEMSYVPGKAVAFYSLIDILADIDDIHKARKMAA